jgi:tetratricopeptide (TPR) repeat protein
MMQEYGSLRAFMRGGGSLLLLLAMLAVVGGVYSNHFQNGFHFDDWHTVTQNPYIRDLRNMPLFFADARTMSVLPANQVYRPVVTASLAIDYWIGRGLNPVAFHASTFCWFLVLLGCTFALFRRILTNAWAGQNCTAVSLFAAASFGLHPVSAETVNYVVQRADLYVALGMVSGLGIYASFPDWRKWGLYLVPVFIAGLCKPTALIFPAFVVLYSILSEHARPIPAFRRAIPALGTTALLAVLHSRMTPASFTSSSSPWFEYVITQPWITVHYFSSWFLPLGLTADSDFQAFPSLWTTRALAGFAFVIALLIAAAWCARRARLKPIAFGLFWFLISLAPAALMPLAEVENDHRMFLPFIGLSLAITCAAAEVYESLSSRHLLPSSMKRAWAAVCLAILGAYGAGAHVRNNVWRTDETLWFDVTQKSPRNGRGLMNYGLTQMEKGKYSRALEYFERALQYTPNYSYLHINLGIARGALNEHALAEAHFRTAAALAGSDAAPRFYYGRYLKERGQVKEAIEQLRAAVERNPLQTDARALLMRTYAEAGRWDEVRLLAADTISLIPNDREAKAWLARAATQPQATPEAYLGLSLTSFQAGHYRDCIEAARQALRLRPDYAEAYNNIAAGHQALGEWDEAISAAAEAIRIRPDFQLARNNLAWSQRQKSLVAKRTGAGRRM